MDLWLTTRRISATVDATLQFVWKALSSDGERFLSAKGDGMNGSTAAYASTPLSMASLRLRRLRGRWNVASQKPRQ
jgi:hypothetical protein